MLLAYLDESYDDDRYWIAALVLPDALVGGLWDRLDAVVQTAADRWSVAPDAELHGYSIFHGCDSWEDCGQRARIAVYRDALKAIPASGATVLVRGVNIPGLERRYVRPQHPHVVVLRHLIEQIDTYATRCGEPIFVIADEVQGQDGHKRALWHYQQHATGGYKSKRIKAVVGTINFSESHLNRPVQAVDLVAFLHRRIQSGCETDPRAQEVNAMLWEQVAGSVSHSHCWHP